VYKIAFQSKPDHPRTGNVDMFFADLDLKPMTLLYELDVR